jgi:hypothetical protein
MKELSKRCRIWEHVLKELNLDLKAQKISWSTSKEKNMQKIIDKIIYSKLNSKSHCCCFFCYV